MATKLTDGNVVIVKALVDTSVGDIVVFGTHRIGLAQTAGLIGEDISVDVKGGISIPAATAEAFVVGDLVKFDTVTKKCLSTGTVAAGTVLEGKLATVAGNILVLIG